MKFLHIENYTIVEKTMFTASELSRLCWVFVPETILIIETKFIKNIELSGTQDINGVRFQTVSKINEKSEAEKAAILNSEILAERENYFKGRNHIVSVDLEYVCFSDNYTELINYARENSKNLILKEPQADGSELAKIYCNLDEKLLSFILNDPMFKIECKNITN